MVYLIHVTQHEPRRLDLTNVWVLHAASRSIYKAAVDMRTESQDPAEMVLRIRCDYVPSQHVLDCALPYCSLASAVTPCMFFFCLMTDCCQIPGFANALLNAEAQHLYHSSCFSPVEKVSASSGSKYGDM